MPALSVVPNRVPTQLPSRLDVLVVEDDAAMREQLALALTDDGFTVATATNGLEALDILRASQIRLIVLDLMLPVMSGRELTQVVRATPELAPIPIVMVTAVGNVHVAPPGPVYLKPIHRESFLRAVRLHIERSGDQNRSNGRA
jgi:CheY-like chemotaxis protein